MHGLPSVVAWKWSENWCLSMSSTLGKYSSTWQQWSKALPLEHLSVLVRSQCNECSGVRGVKWQDQGHVANLGQSWSWKVGASSACCARLHVASVALSFWICLCPWDTSFQKLPKPWLCCFPPVARPGLWLWGFCLWAPASGWGEMGGCLSAYGTVLAVSWGAVSVHLALSLHTYVHMYMRLVEHIEAMLKNTAEELDAVPMTRLSQQAAFKGTIALSWSNRSWMRVSISLFPCPNTVILIKGEEFVYPWDNKFYAKFQPDGTENSWEIIAPKPGFK